jgi:hypothetical protein
LRRFRPGYVEIVVLPPYPPMLAGTQLAAISRRNVHSLTLKSGIQPIDILGSIKHLTEVLQPLQKPRCLRFDILDVKLGIVGTHYSLEAIFTGGYI